MKTKAKSINCGDWHRSCGLGTNKIGKLHTTDTPGTYLWKGHCQGRHGQVWNRGSRTTFSVANGEIKVIEQLGANLPDERDVMEAIRILNSK